MDGGKKNPVPGRRRTAGAHADVEKGLALGELEVLERRAVDRRRREVEHAVAQRHVRIGVSIAHVGGRGRVERL